MAHGVIAGRLQSMLRALDPRRSLVVGAMWLIIGLAVAFSIAATVWVGSIARENVLEQHMRRLALETDQLSSDLGQALAVRLDAIRAAGRILQATTGRERSSGLSDVFNELISAYPQLDWIAVADSHGAVVRANGGSTEAPNVVSSPWFATGLRGPWLGVVAQSKATRTPAGSNTAELGDMAAPVRDDTGKVVGVIAAHLSWRRSPYHPERLTDESDPIRAAQAYVLDRNGIVLIGPDGTRDKPWSGAPIEPNRSATLAPEFERLPDGRRVLICRALLSAGNEVAALGWQVQLTEPNERVYQRANALALKILWVSMCLGAATALLGVLGARQLTGRLKRLARSVASVGQSEAARIEVPGGVDEVAQLAQAFAKILGDLQRERRELQILSGELERRVAVRTREVERLAEESRYAAIVRERLKIARDLHDTLAHSMMAILSEIRFLRRLQARDPAAVPEELARAEQVAHEGLKEARTAITQMRVNAVRDTGLGAALSSDFERFINRTGLRGEFSADVESARFGDERAETILRMAQEALRNVERHAMASRVTVSLQTTGTQLRLRIEDDGVGFDPQGSSPGHYGIVGLREQAQLIGAELCIDSSPGQGTKLTLSLPLSPVAFGQG
ncbi:MAG: histidine kinase [Steroidobacteraceae bacterium]|jgi:signal transduction histidine kinase